jgi:eukaryotic-like serine/threonine-protein kinase
MSNRDEPTQKPTNRDELGEVTLRPGGTSALTPPSGTPVGSYSSSASSINLKAVLEPGQVLAGRYRVESMLGLGGMGTVYKAEDTLLSRTLAIKVIRPDLAADPELLQRFKQEVILARQVSHRNVVRLYDITEADGVTFITMEYVEGTDLRTYVELNAPLPIGKSIDLVTQVVSALQSAHAEDVVHRDLKPGNIMVQPSGRVTVMDFGLARSLVDDGRTKTGIVMGTIDYMSPEQARGEHVDGRSDIFAIGLILYEMLTGEIPHKSESAVATLVKRSQERAKAPSELNRSIPPGLSKLISKCLEIDPKDRYQSAEELLFALDAYRAQPTVLSMQAFALERRARRSRNLFIAASFLVIVSVAIGVYFYQGRSLTKAPVATRPPVSVLVADFQNHTGDPIFDETLEPMFNVALEGASFINAFNRGEARKLIAKMPGQHDKIDEQAARLLAVSQNIGAVVTGSLSRRGDGYKISVEAFDGISGTSIAASDVTVASKDDVLLAIPKLAAPLRKALGDSTPEAAQLQATQGGFTSSSLEAVHQYGLAMELQFAGKMDPALRAFTKATELDPNFGRAYSGMAAMSRNLGRQADAERYFKLAMEHVDRMTERERFRARGAYYVTVGDLQKCVEEYSTLVQQFPSDNIGHNNLAACYARLHNMPNAMEQAQKAVEVSPNAATQRVNHALYAAYAGSYETAENEARAALKINPSYSVGFLTLTDALVGGGKLADATSTLQELSKLGPAAASTASAVSGEIDSYSGLYSQAIKALQEGASADIAAKNGESAGYKFASMAYASLSMGNTQQAIDAAERAVKNNSAVAVRFLAARVLIEAGAFESAKKLIDSLSNELAPEPKVYAKILEGEMAMKQNQVREAIEIFRAANSTIDTWIGRFDLGRAYLAANMFTEASSEFDLAMKRRGEALELMDDGPTYSYIPPVYYYNARVLEALKSSGASDAYRKYVELRGASGEDLLAKDANVRLSALGK